MTSDNYHKNVGQSNVLEKGYNKFKKKSRRNDDETVEKERKITGKD